MVVEHYHILREGEQMKETTIVCRLKATEKEILETEAKRQKITLSQLIRHRVMNEEISPQDNMKLTETLCNLMTEVRKLRENNPDINIDGVEKEAEKLWRF